MSYVVTVEQDNGRYFKSTKSKNMRIVDNEDSIRNMSNGSFLAYRKRVRMYSKFIYSLENDRFRSGIPFIGPGVLATIDWLRSSVSREFTYRKDATKYAEQKASERGEFKNARPGYGN